MCLDTYQIYVVKFDMTFVFDLPMGIQRMQHCNQGARSLQGFGGVAFKCSGLEVQPPRCSGFEGRSPRKCRGSLGASTSGCNGIWGLQPPRVIDVLKMGAVQ